MDGASRNVASPLAGVILADYAIPERTHLDVLALFEPNGRYRFLGGINPAAIAAVAIGLAVYDVLPDESGEGGLGMAWVSSSTSRDLAPGDRLPEDPRGHRARGVSRGSGREEGRARRVEPRDESFMRRSMSSRIARTSSRVRSFGSAMSQDTYGFRGRAGTRRLAPATTTSAQSTSAARAFSGSRRRCPPR